MACLQTQQWHVKIHHVRYSEKLKSKVDKHEVRCEIIYAFRS